MYDDIWAYDISTIYPVGIRNTAYTPSGTFIMVDGVGSSTKTGSVVSESSNFGRVNFTPSGGDSGAAVFQPQLDGTAKLYGMMTNGAGSYGIYEPYDYIKSQLQLTW